mmetsp:Transcript_81836/g.227969  ORF Transcript_81836/g.227969 Transcript_81836/m.227969 type:complete len:467 (-) Transcript_81836:71-1471(-)
MYIYHERQLGNLCGVHCVNNLLQGPRFGPGDLAEIGVRLDKKEQSLLGGLRHGSSENFDSSAEGGNFSIQVLRVALARTGLRLLPAEHPHARELMENPACATAAYLVQRRNHWLALRAAGPCWWDLDSMLERPKPIVEQDLDARVRKWLRGGNSTVFLVLGVGASEPRPPAGAGDTGDSNWHSVDTLLSLNHDDSASAVRITNWHTGGAFADAAEVEGQCSFGDTEMRVALALVGGDDAAAVILLRRARVSVVSKVQGTPARLAKALSAAVENVLLARTTLPDRMARLIALLCAPGHDKIAAAAGFVDCGDLAHRLLTALARKARSFLWTDGFAEAATIVVELLLALPSKSASGDASASSSNEDTRSENEEEAAVNAVGATTTFTSASRLAAGEVMSPRERQEVFEALDGLLGTSEPEGRSRRPSNSAPGLKQSSAASAKPTRSMALRRDEGSRCTQRGKGRAIAA